MWMIYMKQKSTGKIYPCDAKWPKHIAQEIADALNENTDSVVEYYIVDEDNPNEPYICEAGSQTTGAFGDTETQEVDSAG